MFEEGLKSNFAIVEKVSSSFIQSLTGFQPFSLEVGSLETGMALMVTPYYRLILEAEQTFLPPRWVRS